MSRAWTETEIEVLMARAATFTDRGKRIRWGEVAPETGHPASSCAQKYHNIVGLASSRLARARIDAVLAVKDPIPYRKLSTEHLR